jgi:hypothetical protein
MEGEARRRASLRLVIRSARGFDAKKHAFVLIPYRRGKGTGAGKNVLKIFLDKISFCSYI